MNKDFSGWISGGVININRRGIWYRHCFSDMSASSFRRWRDLIHRHDIERRFEINEYGVVDAYFLYKSKAIKS